MKEPQGEMFLLQNRCVAPSYKLHKHVTGERTALTWSAALLGTLWWSLNGPAWEMFWAHANQEHHNLSHLVLIRLLAFSTWVQSNSLNTVSGEICIREGLFCLFNAAFFRLKIPWWNIVSSYIYHHILHIIMYVWYDGYIAKPLK